MFRLITALFLSALLLGSQSQARADYLSPSSYSMPNGYGTGVGGTYQYWDKSYSGSGSTTTDGAPLSGGLGDLFNGFASSSNWYNVENSAGTGPYVGWKSIDPLIKFYFPSVVNIKKIAIHFDDSNGFGGVYAPRGVIINGVEYAMVDPEGSDPFWQFFWLDVNTDQLDIQLLRNNTDGPEPYTNWVFADEFTFNNVPEPTSLMMLLSGFGLMGLRRWQKRRDAIA